ncbi:MAG: hypothetical protein Q8R11_03845 [bacterium]|nr:hypothetical protein [bacterium]
MITWPLSARMAREYVWKVSSLPLLDVDRLYGLARRHGVISIMSEQHKKSVFSFFSRDVFLAFSALCWTKLEYFRRQQIYADNFNELITAAHIALGKSDLRNSIQRPRIPDETGGMSFPEGFIESPQRITDRFQVWNRDAMTMLLASCPEGEQKVDFAAIGLSHGTADIMYCIARRVRGASDVCVFEPYKMTYVELRRMLLLCLRVFDRYPQMQTIVNIFFLVRERDLRAKGPVEEERGDLEETIDHLDTVLSK